MIWIEKLYYIRHIVAEARSIVKENGPDAIPGNLTKPPLACNNQMLYVMQFGGSYGKD